MKILGGRNQVIDCVVSSQVH